MDRLQSLQYFVRVVETGSFSVTSREFAVAQASISKHVNKLEKELATKLLARTTRRLKLTVSGEKFYLQAKSIIEQYDFAVGELKNLKQKPSGCVRLASPILFGRKYITPALSRFSEVYPDITIEHYLSDSQTDLIKEGIDISIRMGSMIDSTHIARKLTEFKYVTVASKEFVEKYGVPKVPSDLQRFRCLISLNLQSPFQWNYVGKDGKKLSIKVSGPYQSNVTEAVREAVIAGMGIWRAPTSAVAAELRDGTLIKLLTDFESPMFPVFAVFPASLYVPRKIRVLTEFLHTEFQKNNLLK